MTTISRLEANGVPVTAHGGPLETKVMVYDTDQLRSLLDLGLDEKGRQAHFQAMFDGITVPDDAGAQLVHKVTAHVIGNGELSAQDKAAAAPLFPMTFHVSAAPGPVTVNAPSDLSTPDGSPRVVSFTDVIMEQGGYFVCNGTPLIFTCNTLTRNGNSGSNVADFNILGKPGVTPATPAQPGGATQAAAGYTGECSSVGIAGHGGGPGNPGAPGSPGTPGSAGGQGTPSMQTTITIQTTLTATTLSVFSQSGRGGQGGNGGQGGPGQQGGNGGNGVTCDCTGNAGGQGGDGGSGGTGGAAGNGGNGVDAAGNVTVRVPTQSDVGKVTTSTAPAPPGGPGTPGPGGPPGSGGSGGKNNSGGTGGGTGAYGGSGAQGQPATVTGRAAQINVMPL
jgi:hypothetical protein